MLLPIFQKHLRTHPQRVENSNQWICMEKHHSLLLYPLQVEDHAILQQVQWPAMHHHYFPSLSHQYWIHSVCRWGGKIWLFLRHVCKIAKSDSFIVSVCLAVCLLTWKNLSPTEWIFMKFLSRKFKFH